MVDFGLAELKEFAQIKEEEIVGTFSYMSPEQSGIIRKPIDERSDLYSVGVIFYQLLTGDLPFKGKDISTILHQQIAKVPDSPSKLKKDIPKILEEIVLKLLNKEQEERYQSAKGLLADLRRYQDGERDFVLGKEDKLIKLPFSTRLVGREEEISHLKDLFNQASGGKGKVCLISGEAGRGKTRLVEELRGYVYEKGGVFLSGRCLDQENKIPYQPFREALDEYIRSLHRRKKEDKEQIIESMKESVGESGEIIITLNPLMKEILRDVPSLVPLEPDRETKRFLMICSRFFRNLGEAGRPVVLSLDDLQWADEGSLSLLREIVQDIGKSPLLILGTYRDNEVTSEHSLVKLKSEAEERELPLEEINLSLFDYLRMNRLVASLLLEEEDSTREISRYILDKSKGNPFFAIETLRQLVDEKVICHQSGLWNVDWERLQEAEISPTILDVVLRRIALLKGEEANLLSYAAIIGREFDLNLLFKLSELEKEGVVSIVDRAIDLQLLEESLTEKGRILFVHDRIKEAFYQKVGGEWLKTAEGLGEVHLRMGRNDDAIGIFNEILPFKVKDIEKAKIYRQLSTAYLNKGDWSSCEEQGRRGLRLLGEKLPLTKAGVFLGLAKELFIHILHNSFFPRIFTRKEGKQVDEKYPLIIWLYLPLAWMYILSDTAKFVRTAIRLLNIAEGMIGKSKELGMGIGGYASVCMAIPLFKRAIKYHEKGLSLRRELGDEWGVAQSLQWMGHCYQWKGEYQNSTKYFQESLTRFQNMGDVREMGVTLIGLAYSYYYSSDYKRAIDNACQCLEIAQNMNDNYEISNSAAILSWLYTEMGEFDKAEEWGIKSLTLSEEKGIFFINCLAKIHLGHLNLERGKPADALKYLEKAKILNEKSNFLKDYVVLLYPYLAEAYLMQFIAAAEDITVKEKELYLKKIRRACKDALHKNRSWATHYGGALRIQGKYYALIRKGKKAEEFF